VITVATEYTLQSDADLTIDSLRTFFESAIDGDAGTDGTVFRPALYVMASRVADDERDETTELFGFTDRVFVTFRFANLAEVATRDQNIAVMVSAVLAFHKRFGGRGVLLFNGEVAVIQWEDADLIFSSDWEDWFEVEPVIPLVAGRRVERLPQPLL
jgi:hypothetical protein